MGDVVCRERPGGGRGWIGISDIQQVSERRSGTGTGNEQSRPLTGFCVSICIRLRGFRSPKQRQNETMTNNNHQRTMGIENNREHYHVTVRIEYTTTNLNKIRHHHQHHHKTIREQRTPSTPHTSHHHTVGWGKVA